MENNVQITISGLQRELDPEPTVVECEGSYVSRDGLYYLRFSEHDEASGAVTRSMIKLQPDHITVTKNGAVNSRLEFIPGREYTTLYSTAFGDFETVIKTSQIQLVPSDTGIDALILYGLSMGGQEAVRCRLTIKAVPLQA